MNFETISSIRITSLLFKLIQNVIGMNSDHEFIMLNNE